MVPAFWNWLKLTYQMVFSGAKPTASVYCQIHTCISMLDHFGGFKHPLVVTARFTLWVIHRFPAVACNWSPWLSHSWWLVIPNQTGDVSKVSKSIRSTRPQFFGSFLPIPPPGRMIYFSCLPREVKPPRSSWLWSSVTGHCCVQQRP